jgi:hypothetical protein
MFPIAVTDHLYWRHDMRGQALSVSLAGDTALKSDEGDLCLNY